MLKHIIRFASIALIYLGIGQTDTFATEVKNPDKEKPVEIQSDFAVFDDKKGTATYTGHVIMLQENRHLTSDTLIILSDAHGKMESMIATGDPAHFQVQPNPEKPFIKGEAKTIQYFPKQDKVLLLKDAVLIQNEDTIRGDRLIYFPSTQVLFSEPIPGKQTTIILAPKA